MTGWDNVELFMLVTIAVAIAVSVRHIVRGVRKPRPREGDEPR